MNNFLQRSISGFAVSIGVTGLRFGIGFGTQFFLVRILTPEDFGIIAFAWMIVSFLSALTNVQSNKYLIQAKEEINYRVDVAFTIELILSLTLLVLTFLLAPFIMQWVNRPDQTAVMQVLLLTFLYYPFVPLRALLEKNLSFGKANIPEIIGLLCSAITSITLALMGLGVWSLVWGRVVQFLLPIILFWWLAPYRPRLRFNLQMTREIVKFGWPLIGSAFLVFFYWNIDYYLVGTLLDDQQLGYYWLGFQFTHYLLQMKTALNQVTYPVFCAIDSKAIIARSFTALSQYTAVSFFLPCLILLLLGKQTVTTLFGVEWLPSTQVVQIFSVLTALRAVFNYWDPVFLMYGQTKFMLWATIANSIILPIIGYIMTKLWGINGMAMAVLITIGVITPFLASKLITLLDGVSYQQILMKPLLILCITLSIGWSGLHWFSIETTSQYLMAVCALTMIYLTCAWFVLDNIRADLAVGIQAIKQQRIGRYAA